MKKVENQIKKILKSFLNLQSKLTETLKIKILLVLFFVFIPILHIAPTKIVSSTPSKAIMPNNEIAYIFNLRDKLKTQLSLEIDNFIYSITPDSKLTSEYLMKKCLEYDMDITFVLAQGLLESHFGTKGKAVITNSVWNVGTYDNGKILYRYISPDESIEPYLKLLKDNYLKDKELHNLVQDEGYTNHEGRRYATARYYENGMRKLMIKIKLETSIGLYQDLLRISDQKLVSFFMPPSNLNTTSDLQAMK